MGFFDFLKKKKDIPVKEQEEKIFTIEEIELSLNNKKQEAKSKENSLVNKVNSLSNHLISELKEKNEKLKKVDLAKKEENQNVKDLVLENVKVYSNFIDELVLSLEAIKEENLQTLINEINKKMINFERNSKFSYGRANFLVGKEITTTRESIKEFFNDLNKMMSEEKEFLGELSKTNLIEKQIKELNKEQENCDKIKKEIKEINVKKLELERQQEILKENIVETEKSSDYLEKEQKKEKAKQDKKELEKELLKIKTSIDWKKLNELFHSVKKKMELIKSYEQDFSKILLNEEELISVLKEANVETEEISNKINQIKTKKKGIEDLLAQKDDLEGARFNFNSNETEIKSLIEKEERISKKFYELEENIVKIKEKINAEYKSLLKKL